MKGSFILLIIGLFCWAATAASGDKRSSSVSSAQMKVTYRILDINRLNLRVTDRGNLVKDLGTTGGGTWWYTATDYMSDVVYDHGPWIIGKGPNGIVMGNAYWGTSYTPGPVINGRSALEVTPQDSGRFHPYKINRTSTEFDPDIWNWPRDLGAPVDARNRPLAFGDQMIWTLFNDADSTVRAQDWYSYAKFDHLPVEIHQAVYAHFGGISDTSLLANTAFIEWTFINKGSFTVDSCYLGLWTDIDLYSADTPFGVDTTLQMGYCWDKSALDTAYQPRATAYTLLYGPRVPDAGSNALFRGRVTPGFKNLPLSSFWGLETDYGSILDGFATGPRSIEEAWNIARGYDKAGNVIIDSVTKLPTRFPWSGDPVTGRGWVYEGSTDGEGGFLFFMGPFTFAPGDTQWTLLALHPAAAANFAEAITAVRGQAARLQHLTYEEIASAFTLSAPEATDLPVSPILHQNYPNPFNPSTTIRYALPHRSRVTLTVFNTLGQTVADLVNGEVDAGYHEVLLNIEGLASGVYFYRLQADDFADTKKLLLIK